MTGEKRMIRSKENGIYKGLKKLLRSRRERRRLGQALVEGARLVEACLAGRKPVRIVLSAKAEGLGTGRPILRALPEVPVTVVSDSLFRELSTLTSPDGIMAVIEIARREEGGGRGDVLFLDGLQDPGNLGTILRSAAAAGISLVGLSPGCADPWAPKVLRGGMGAHFALAIREEPDLRGAVETFDGQVLVLDAGAEESLYASDLTGKTAFVVGGEGAGVTNPVAEAADRVVSIPMPGWNEPLNAAAAASICLFELVRQRQGAGSGGEA